MLRYRATRDPAAIDEAVKSLESAVASIRSGGDRHRLAIAVSNLGAARSWRYEQTEKDEDLDAAIGYCREAVAMTADNDPYYSMALSNLASILMSHWREPATCPTGPRR